MMLLTDFMMFLGYQPEESRLPYVLDQIPKNAKSGSLGLTVKS